MKKQTLSVFIWAAFLLFAAACKKDNYYQDGGLQNGKQNVSSYEFLKARPVFFDTLITIIDAAGLKDVLSKESVTFFAPHNRSILQAMNALNAARYARNQDSLFLKDIPGEIWQQFLTRYIFRDKYMLKDIARRDSRMLQVFPGQYLESMNGYIMNLGVQFSDYSGTKDVGPRTVLITDIGDLSNPVNITANAGTSDIQTTNGIVHVLDGSHIFSFNMLSFVTAVQDHLQ